MTFDFTGKSVLVTGAAHGFGRSIALSFAKCGAQVTVCDIAAAGLAETAQLVGGLSLVLDVGKRAAVQAALAGQAYDILVSNAGGVLHQTGRPLEEVSHIENSIQHILPSQPTGPSQNEAPNVHPTIRCWAASATCTQAGHCWKSRQHGARRNL